MSHTHANLAVRWVLAAIFLATVCATLAEAQISAQIVNGEATTAFPAVGALLLYADAEQSSLDGVCSGTLIGCRTFLTAAHCVCNGTALDAASCEGQGRADPRSLRVFLQSGGLFDVVSTAIHPDFAFAERGDVAIVELATAVTGIEPASINSSARPAVGMRGTVVGFGTTGGRPSVAVDLGVKREGKVSLAPCADGIPDESHLCWEFTGTDSNICSGDSGGPLFMDLGSGSTVAGVTSGHERTTCQVPDMSFDTDVFVHRDWIFTQAGVGDTRCGSLALVDGGAVTIFEDTATLDETSPELRFAFSVPPGTRLLRVALNGQLQSGAGFTFTINDFDLFIGAGREPTDEDFDCADEGYLPFGFCQRRGPQPGLWHVLVTRFDGEGVVQAVATVFPDSGRGDANCDDRRTVADLTRLALLIPSDIDPCGRADVNDDGVVDEADITALLSDLFDSP